ncbi:MAG: beta-galactosidase [Paraglaciecola sp.]|uniref:beta-galactosidase n=1 Tax=Paraglaciecola sp. TaxID=1920173 RepID=UPI003296D0AA
MKFLFVFTITMLLSCSGTAKHTISQNRVTDNSVQVAVKPSGIFVGSGPTVSDDILSLEHVTGNLIRVGWNEVQPSSGEYDFSKLDALIDQAQRLNKKVTLSILNGPRAPQWLYAKGAKAFKYEFKNRHSERGNRQEVIPLPWDPVYLKYWQQLIVALGQKYQANNTISLIHITHSSKNGFEMHLPEERIAGKLETPYNGPWKDMGYQETQYIDSLKSIVDTYMTAFPNHFLDLEIHPVLGSLKPATDVFHFAFDKYGSRFGLFAAWWSGKKQRWNTAMYGILSDACVKSFCSVQIIGNQTRQPNRLFEGDLIKTMQQAQSLGVNYFEVWDIDLRNDSLRPKLVNFNTRYKGGN